MLYRIHSIAFIQPSRLAIYDLWPELEISVSKIGQKLQFFSILCSIRAPRTKENIETPIFFVEIIDKGL